MIEALRFRYGDPGKRVVETLGGWEPFAATSLRQRRSGTVVVLATSGLLITILVILVIIALLLYILRSRL